MAKADSRRGRALADIAEQHGATVGQIAIAWLLATSDVIVPIPGTSQLAHLEQTLAASQGPATTEIGVRPAHPERHEQTHRTHKTTPHPAR